METQPPSGGCELKPRVGGCVKSAKSQPPSGGCELKRIIYSYVSRPNRQPPSGGCELKLALLAANASTPASRLRAAVS